MTLSAEPLPGAVPLHYLGGGGPPLLISHATGFHGRAYAPLAAVLAESFTVYALDHRCHGDAGDPPDGDRSFDAMAADLLAVAVELGPDTCVFGHSMGATAALLALRSAPDAFAGAFLFEPSVLHSREWLGPRLEQWTAGIRRRRTVFASRESAFAALAERPPYSRFRADALWAFVEGGTVLGPEGTAHLKCLPEHEAQLYEREAPVVADFAGLRGDIVLCAGSRDDLGVGLVPPPVAEALPDAVLVELRGVGHFAPFEDPDRLGRTVLRVLNVRES